MHCCAHWQASCGGAWPGGCRHRGRPDLETRRCCSTASAYNDFSNYDDSDLCVFEHDFQVDAWICWQYIIMMRQQYITMMLFKVHT